MTKHELLMHEFVTHDTRRFILSRPDGLDWEPGQGVELAIDSDQWRDEGHPFTPTSLTGDHALEFIIKRYEDGGMTSALHDLEAGAGLNASEPFGTIRYQGPGVFIAAGAGITPFIAILRHLATRDELQGQKLLFSNKSERDLICGDELRHLLGERAIFTFTREHSGSNAGQRIDADFLRARVEDFEQKFYICGPDAFVEEIKQDLLTLGADPDSLVYEQ